MCRECQFTYSKEYREKNKAKIASDKKEHYENNKLQILEERKEYAKINKTKIAQTKKRYYKNNKPKLLNQAKENYLNKKETKLQYGKEYAKNNKRKVLDSQNKSKRNRRRKDPVYRFRQNISRYILFALRSQRSSKNQCSILEFFPSTLKETWNHIESQFEWWMTRENQGRYIAAEWDDNDPATWKWQLDHIISQFNLPYTSMEDENFKKCWALSNLRPLSAKQNVLDGNRPTDTELHKSTMIRILEEIENKAKLPKDD